MIEAKGKNGYFKVDRLNIWRTTNNPPEILIDIYSRRSGDAPPARIQGPAEEMKGLIYRLYEAVIEASPAGLNINGVGTDQIRLEKRGVHEPTADCNRHAEAAPAK